VETYTVYADPPEIGDAAKQQQVASQLAAPLGITLPITDEPVQVHATEPVAPVIPHLVYYAGGRLTLKQAHSGTLLIGGDCGPTGIDCIWIGPVRSGGGRGLLGDPVTLS